MRNLLGSLVQVKKEYCLSWTADISPCQASCPLEIDIESFIKAIARGDFAKALDIIKEDCPMPEVCSRICYAPCESSCKRGAVDTSVAICSLKRAAVDYGKNRAPERLNERPGGDRVAVVGSGPAGLSCAYYCARRDYQVTVFEASPFVGGMLRIGIPEYRLPKEALERDIEDIRKAGVEILTEKRIGQSMGLSDLFEMGYKAIFLATGSNKSSRLNLPGEDSEGIINGSDFLKGMKTGKRIDIGKKVAVIGGGNTGFDAARCALRLGSSVSIFDRLSKEEMPVYDSEMMAAQDEGICINPLVVPIGFDSDSGHVSRMRCVKIKRDDLDESGQSIESVIEGSEFSVEVDSVIIAVGGEPDTSYILMDDGIEVSEAGTIKVDPLTLATNRKGVFAGGDACTGPETAISAMADGKKAAASIDHFLKGRETKPTGGFKLEPRADDLPEGIISREREKVRLLPAMLRKNDFREIDQGFGPEEAKREAGRCLRCRSCNRCLEDFDCVAIMPTENNGKVSPDIDAELCVGCQVCIQVCPYGHIGEKEMEDGGSA